MEEKHEGRHIRKPDPRLFLICLERLGVDSGEGIFIGDGANDELLSATSVGLTAILLNNHDAISKKRLKTWNGFTISSFDEIDAILADIEVQYDGCRPVPDENPDPKIVVRNAKEPAFCTPEELLGIEEET